MGGDVASLACYIAGVFSPPVGSAQDRYTAAGTRDAVGLGRITPATCWRPGPCAGSCWVVPWSPAWGLTFATYHLSAKFGRSGSILP